MTDSTNNPTPVADVTIAAEETVERELAARKEAALQLDSALEEFSAAACKAADISQLIAGLRDSDRWIYTSKNMRNGMYDSLRAAIDVQRELVGVIQNALKREKRQGLPEEFQDQLLFGSASVDLMELVTELQAAVPSNEGD